MNPNPFLTQNRRSFLQKSGFGFGGAALASLINQDAAAAADDPLVKLGLHHAPKAKRVIYIHMVGAPSHLDLFDFKPELQKRTGELCPDEFFDLNQLAFIREQPNLLGTPKDERFSFKKCGQSGTEISNLLPNIQGIADEMCFIKTFHTDKFNHALAHMFSLTGFERFGGPSMWSCTSYE